MTLDEILTKRQMEIARLVVTGHTNRQIAESLCISERSVENAMERAYRRLGFAAGWNNKVLLTALYYSRSDCPGHALCAGGRVFCE